MASSQVESLTRQLSSRRANIRRGLHRLSIILACSWLLGASAYFWTTRPEPTFVCTDSANKGVSRLSSNAQQSANGVRIEGPDGRMYLFPDGTTKPDAISYFKQRCTREDMTARHILVIAAM